MKARRLPNLHDFGLDDSLNSSRYRGIAEDSEHVTNHNPRAILILMSTYTLFLLAHAVFEFMVGHPPGEMVPHEYLV